MKKNVCVFILILLLFSISELSAQSANDKEMVKKVFKQLNSVLPQQVKKTFSINYVILDNVNINAYADKDKKKGSYKVIITKGLLETVVQSIPDRLAYIMGHELAHIVLGHVDINMQTQSDFVKVQYVRQNEIDADTVGMKYALSVGYSFGKALGAIKQMLSLGLEYNSFEGLGADHPTWKERLVYLDKEQANLWKSMSAFENGVFFLTIEQYVPASYCFRAVIKEFPTCYEAWANLGYAYLMQYFDGLEPEDLKKYDIGQIVTGGFYSRAGTLESSVRGIDEDLWWDAIGALKEALRLKGDLALAKANLGVAYLLSPQGKDVGKAEKYFQESIELAEADKTIDNISKSYIYINAGVSDIAGGNNEKCQMKFLKAEEYGSYFGADKKTGVSFQKPLNLSLLYNKAYLMLKDKDKSKNMDAMKAFEKYLKSTNSSSLWWELAYKYYSDVCKELSVPIKTEDEIKKLIHPIFKPVVSLDVDNKNTITISETSEDVNNRLNTYESSSIPVATKTNLKKISYSDLGIELLTSDRVIAIFLKQINSPSVVVQPYGVSSEKKYFNVGMLFSNFEDSIGDEKDNYTFKQLIESDKNYRFYKNLGLALRINKENNTIEELVIVQVSDRI